MPFAIRVNGVEHAVDVDGDTPLLWVLRDVLGLTGTKFGCGKALCGACTVHLNGSPVRSCVLPVGSLGGAEVTTIEAIHTTDAGRRIQQAWLDREVIQCGYCQSGRSCPHPRCSPGIRTRAMRTSMRPCPETSAAAAPTFASVRPSSAPQGRRSARDGRSTDDPRSHHQWPWRSGYSERRIDVAHLAPHGSQDGIRRRGAHAGCEPAWAL